jgi:phosphate:Na+ symporter
LLTILTALAGIGLFLTGLHQISHAMQSLAGNRMRTVVAKLSGNFFSNLTGGVLLGLITFTSSAATFVCMGLVKSDSISFVRVIPVLAWASVGVSLVVLFGAIDIKVGGLLMLSIIGFLDFSRYNRMKGIQTFVPFILSLGLLLLGMGMIKESSHALGQTAYVKELMAYASSSGVLLFLVGGVIAFIAQTSTVPAAIVLMLNISGLISFNSALVVVFGANFGYCLGLYYHAIDMDNINKRIASCSILVKVTGGMLFGTTFLIDPNALIWHFSKVADNNDVAINIYLIVLAIQVSGAIILSLLTQKTFKFLMWLYPDKSTLALSEPKYIYPEAVADPSTAVLLAKQEVDRQLIGLINNLDPLRYDDGNKEIIDQSVRHNANVTISTKISSFIEQVAQRNETHSGIEEIFRVQAKNELVALTQKSLNDFTLTLLPIIKNDISLSSSLVEGLHLILMLLNECVQEVDEGNMLLELTSEKSQLMENIRKTLVSDTIRSVSEKQCLLIATGIFERVLWLVRQVAVSTIEENSRKNYHI